MNLGETIYRLRSERNMSQEALAEALDVSRQSVSKWENNMAVPELEKLIKMSQIFEISLDSLVGMEQSASTAEPDAPRIVYVEKPVFPTFTKNQITGVILLIAAIVLAVVLYSGRFGGMEVFLMILPVALSSVICLIAKHPLFYCGWVGAAAWWLYLFVLFPRWEEQTFLLIVGVLLVFVMVVLSIHLHCRGIIRIPVWCWIVGGFILAFFTWLLLVNTVPPFWIGSSSTPVTTK